ncbi:hypothetical protein S83_036472, partial [Arachis hypogaea]
STFLFSPFPSLLSKSAGVTDPFSGSPLRSVRSLLRRRRSPFILLHRYSGSLPPVPLLASSPASLASPAASPSSL